MMNILDEKMVVLVNSCDKYSDIWPVFFELFFKYWPDCPYPIFLGSNENIYNDSRVTTLCVGPDKSWADTTRAMLTMIPAENILWFLDDFFLCDKVSTSDVAGFYEQFLMLQANYMRLQRDGGSDKLKRIIDDKLVEILPGDEYRTSLGIAFWKRTAMLDLLKSGETPWEMEFVGSGRSDHLNGFYASRRDVFQRINGLERGKWLRHHLPFYAREGIAIPAGHSVVSRSEHFAKMMKRYIKQYLKRSLIPLRSVCCVLNGKK
jgi:hypothetical protein